MKGSLVDTERVGGARDIRSKHAMLLDTFLRKVSTPFNLTPGLIESNRVACKMPSNPALSKPQFHLSIAAFPRPRPTETAGRAARVPSGKRQGSAAPGDETIPSLFQKYFYPSTTPTCQQTETVFLCKSCQANPTPYCNETGLRHRVSPCRSAYFASPWWLLTLAS